MASAKPEMDYQSKINTSNNLDFKAEFDRNGTTVELDPMDQMIAALRGRSLPLDAWEEFSLKLRLNEVRRMLLSRPKGYNRKGLCCVFCKRNGEEREIYTCHNIKNDKGQVVCPILQNYTCPLCRATGTEAHTLKYCPQKYCNEWTPVVTRSKPNGHSPNNVARVNTGSNVGQSRM